MPELTGPQIITKASYAEGVPLANNAKLRRMRKDPVIALVRFMFFAGILSGKWSFEKANADVPDEWVDLIKAQLEPMRRHILATGALGCFDFGFQPYEKVFEVSPELGTYIKKLKPLVQDSTTIVTTESDGSFAGLKAGQIELPFEKALLLYFDAEGTDWSGTSTLANAEKAYDDSMAASVSAKRFDQKMAGAQWVVRYPDGKTNFNGEETPNHEIADQILSSLQSSGMIALPISQAMMSADVFNEKAGWHIELITASGASVEFNQRFEYLDKCKARALGFPERSVLEGNHGTLAEAGAHQDFVLTLIEYRHDCILELINWHLVNQILFFNFGPGTENSVAIVASPINDASKAMLKELYTKILEQPDGFLSELDNIDIPAIASSLGIPRIEQEALVDLVDPASSASSVSPMPTDQTGSAGEVLPPGQTAPQDTALNGAQVGSLVEIATQVTTGVLSQASAKAIIRAAFPLLDQAVINEIIDTLVVKPVTGIESTPAPVTPAAPAPAPASTQPAAD